MHILSQAHVVGLFHVIGEPLHVEDALRLDEIRARVHLLCQTDHAPSNRVGKRVGRSAYEHLWRDSNVLSADYGAVVPHVPHGSEELHGVQIKDTDRLFLISETLVIAGEAEHVPNTKGVCTERSLWSAMRFRSLVTICRIGSCPIALRSELAARDAILTMAVWLSVTLTASIFPSRHFPFSCRASTSEPFPGPHSAVTAKWPAFNTFSRRLSVFTVFDPP
jgi:hypothetical protein